MASIDEIKFVTAFYAPGAVTANASTDLPANYPEMEQLLGGLHITSTGGAFTATTLTAIAYSATPGAGNIALVDGNSFRIGTACDTKTKLVLVYKAVSNVNDKKLVTAIWCPGAVAIDTAMDMPTYYPEIEQIIGGVQLAQSIDDLTSITLAGAVPTTTLGTGYVSKVDGNSIKMGDENDTSDMVILTYRAV
ncbi:hypothetical protein KKF61_08200 [Patescibacteria group bacterium]|nr:hypothetical protein [Patescibacteria group bacterium]